MSAQAKLIAFAVLLASIFAVAAFAGQAIDAGVDGGAVAHQGERGDGH